ncbi:Modification methylase Bsp6I [Labilithrix luteola]|uniref:Modification methylase Bsp6I n=1 Tax=Labilithrix luteola TaxID=1391654 RepID=A0A0K1PJ28_9BACT|nr:hypothetical protein [Labilithrix luteola]AKU93401.1 Modification methylase Bsp6I [Labilithrix luteola]
MDPQKAQHSSESNEHYTPVDLIEAARAVMGGIDLDPATTGAINAAHVKAPRYFTKETNGLDKPWHGRVLLNPPGGAIREGRRVRSVAAMWWDKLVDEWIAGRVEQAVFFGFSVECLATTQDAQFPVVSVPFCIPRKRIQYLQQQDDGTFVPGTAPPHATVIGYLPPDNKEGEARLTAFGQVFSRFGIVRL